WLQDRDRRPNHFSFGKHLLIACNLLLLGLDVCRELNPCTYSKSCKDEQGVTSCVCPKGMIGDGQKNGSGCKKQFPLYTALGVALALTATLATVLLCYYLTMKKRKVERNRAELFRKNGGLLLQQRFSMMTSQGEDSSAKIFSAEELKDATDNYSESRILGRGGSGMVYKGILPNNTTVAIKKSILFDESQVEQFANEITILSQIDHPNVVKLLGCCLETNVPLLVYEFIPNGTLFQHIHNRSSLRWEDCLRIAEETAEALDYLHSTSSTPIIHRDIKSSNILLDENLMAKISDFGASRSVPFDQTHVTTLIQGTIGYLDPEYFQSSKLTEKSDVYSFGVVLAELLTRQKPISASRPEESCNLAMYIVNLFNERRLLQEIEPHILAEAGEEQIHAVAQLSVRCLNLKGEERPVMREVASVLHGLRESFDEEQIIRRSNESIQITNGQDSVHSEARPIPSLQSSGEITTEYSLPAEILPSSYLAR
ncbi:Os04g0598600, partial [Oryza sativa Japonica Group]